MAVFEVEEEVTRKKQVDIDLPAYFVMTKTKPKESNGKIFVIVRIKSEKEKPVTITFYNYGKVEFTDDYYGIPTILKCGTQVDKSEWDFAVSLVKKQMEG